MKFSYINFCEGHEIESIFHAPESGTDEYIEIRIPLTVDVIGAINQIDRWRGEHDLAFIVVPDKSYSIITKAIRPDTGHVVGEEKGKALARLIAKFDGSKLPGVPVRLAASSVVSVLDAGASINDAGDFDGKVLSVLRRHRRDNHLQ